MSLGLVMVNMIMFFLKKQRNMKEKLKVYQSMEV